MLMTEGSRLQEGMHLRKEQREGLFIVAVMITMAVLMTNIATKMQNEPSPAPRRLQQSKLKSMPVDPGQDLEGRLNEIFQARAEALLTRDPRPLTNFYEPVEGRTNPALEHEQGRIRYVQSWAKNRTVSLTESTSRLLIDDVEIQGAQAWVALRQSASFAYMRRGTQAGAAGGSEPDRFGIGTRHRLHLVRGDGGWRIVTDEYTDPLEEDTLIRDVAPACGPIDAPLELSDGGRLSAPPGPSTIAWQSERHIVPTSTAIATYDRNGAVAYANRFCGSAPGCGNGNSYNLKYKDYNDLGGDCTNFISQALGDPEGGKLPMTRRWRVDPITQRATSSWVQTEAFADFLRKSGQGSLVAKGAYGKVVRPTRSNPRGAIGALRPGDLIGYEEDNRIQHFVIIVGKDSRGHPVVNSHTSDRYHVPWDLGWDRKTVYWLFRVGQ